jgi:branched-subunit amino acid ABC-type transport system permease component
MGGLFAYLAVEATAALKRKATIYGLIAVAALIGLFAAGYAVDAVYTVLMFRYGPLKASLFVAGALLFLALIALIAARVIADRRPTPVVPSHLSSPYSHPPVHLPYSRKRMVAILAGLAGAGTTALALAKSRTLRNLLRGRR